MRIFGFQGGGWVWEALGAQTGCCCEADEEGQTKMAELKAREKESEVGCLIGIATLSSMVRREVDGKLT